MNEGVQEQMYIITAPCWKCDNTINIAIIKGDVKKRNGFCGPELFSEEEKKLAENYNVIIREHHSYTREETYYANTCLHCNTFIGQHYLFAEYFVSAVNGDYEYGIIDII